MQSLWGPALSQQRLLLLTVMQVLSLHCLTARCFWTAYINVSFTEPGSNQTGWERSECGVYGQNSPLESVRGLVGYPVSTRPWGCDTDEQYHKPPDHQDWIALMERGNGCTFTEKIQNAAFQGAKAVVIFNYPTPNNEVVQMSHPGTENMIAVMIGNNKGAEILNHVREGISVSMMIEVGKQHGPWTNQYSVFFVSISFFVVTAATVGYFIFYSARRWRVARALTRRQKQLKNEAKKVINKLEVRTLKQGDEEIEADADTCAVCIEPYKPGDVVRILTCSHIFHKSCIDPWILEHRTCPMCKCDILKALGIENDEEKDSEQSAPELTFNNSQRNGLDVRTDIPENAIYTLPSVYGPERATEESPISSEEQYLVNNEGGVNSLPVHIVPYDNPIYEEIDLKKEVKS
uniref:E3 ubiquitin-protein ligase RNF128-like protein n=1 Tax=Callorhinchus milii TaxID=7868 RepID=V9KIT2_CALMI